MADFLLFRGSDMILTDYFRSTPDMTWNMGRQLGVKHGVIRLPEDADFDPACREHWLPVYKRFMDFGIKPIIIEPMPNSIHDHIKAGDGMRDESIEKVIKMFPIMDELDIRCICFNFMAHIGWLRTADNIKERGGALVTGFDIKDFKPIQAAITAEQLWDNYSYFIKAVMPEAEKYGINLALHPDDPPRGKLGNVERIMISADNIEHAVRDIYPSKNLGVTFCQATFYTMGEALEKIIPRFADKIMFVHFRNVVGDKDCFRETFHDNGEIDMAEMIETYNRLGLNVPIRVDHVPQMAGEDKGVAGYTALGRLYAIGYLKGLLEMCEHQGK